MDTTKKIAEYIVGITFNEIPQKVISFAKQCILDCLGVALAGSTSPAVKIVNKLVKELEGKPEAVVWGCRFRSSVLMAAFVNGIMAHFLDYDDDSSSIEGHPSAILVPVVLSIGDKMRISGKDALVAYIAGLETEIKIGRGINVGHYEKGWHATATLGTLGAAVAAAKILKLNIDQIRTAIGIAASEAAGLRQNFGTMTKSFHAGNAARSGILAALLANKGFTADKNILEAQFGFCKLFSKDNKYDLNKMTENLGKLSGIILPDISLKPYPSCRCSHSAIDAMLDIVNKYNICPDEVEKIEVKTCRLNSLVLTKHNPKTGLEGKFSMEFCVAIAFLEKQVGLSQFTDEKVQNKKTQSLMKKVNMVVEPSLQDVEERENMYLPSIVAVKIKNSKEYIKRVDIPKGHPLAPLSRQELVDKYQKCVEGVLSIYDSEQLIELVENIENVNDIRKLTNILIT